MDRRKVTTGSRLSMEILSSSQLNDFGFSAPVITPPIPKYPIKAFDYKDK